MQDEALSIPGGADETNWKLFKLTIRINIFCFLNKIGLEVIVCIAQTFAFIID